MTEQELRALVRDAVARHFGGGPTDGGAGFSPPSSLPATIGAAISRTLAAPHASHAMYLTIVNAGDACVIEPGVTCNHCGYCKSHGH